MLCPGQSNHLQNLVHAQQSGARKEMDMLFQNRQNSPGPSVQPKLALKSGHEFHVALNPLGWDGLRVLCENRKHKSHCHHWAIEQYRKWQYSLGRDQRGVFGLFLCLEMVWWDCPGSLVALVLLFRFLLNCLFCLGVQFFQIGTEVLEAFCDTLASRGFECLWFHFFCIAGHGGIVLRFQSYCGLAGR